MNWWTINIGAVLSSYVLSNVSAFVGSISKPYKQPLQPFLSRSISIQFPKKVRNDKLYVKSPDFAENSQKLPFYFANYVETANMTTSQESSAVMDLSVSVMKDFEPAKFCPPDWFTNRHLQTIFGALYRDRCMYMYEDDTILDVFRRLFLAPKQKAGVFQWDERKRYETPDNDFFDVDFKYTIGQPSRGIVLLTHGLESNSNQSLPTDMAAVHHNSGFDVACINFRGCSGEINRQRGAYHLSFTDDLYTLLPQLASTYQKIYLSGFSCGSNVIVQFLSQVGTDAKTKYNIHGAAVNCLPFDLTITAPNINGYNWFTTAVYGNDLKKKLQQKVIDQCNSETIIVPYTIDEVKQCKTIKELEELAICPLYGFKDAVDYYRRSSCKDIIKNVSVPLYIINALDDPFFEGDDYPTDLPPNVILSFTESGGHSGDILHTLPATKKENQRPIASWLSTELGNFVDHIDKKW